jgi:hypothetical protein
MGLYEKEMLYNKIPPKWRDFILFHTFEFFLDLLDICFCIEIIRILFKIVSQICDRTFERLFFEKLFCLRLSFFESTFLIFCEVDTLWKMTSICRKSWSFLIVWEERIPVSPWTPPVSEVCPWEIFRIFLEEGRIIIIIIEILLEGMDFPVYIRTGDDTSFEHNINS